MKVNNFLFILPQQLYKQNKTNALLSIKMPTMSSIINKISQYTIDSHNNLFIGQDNTKKNTKIKSYLVRNIVMMVVFQFYQAQRPIQSTI